MRLRHSERDLVTSFKISSQLKRKKKLSTEHFVKFLHRATCLLWHPSPGSPHPLPLATSMNQNENECLRRLGEYFMRISGRLFSLSANVRNLCDGGEDEEDESTFFIYLRWANRPECLHLAVCFPFMCRSADLWVETKRARMSFPIMKSLSGQLRHQINLTLCTCPLDFSRLDSLVGLCE